MSEAGIKALLRAITTEEKDREAAIVDREKLTKEIAKHDETIKELREDVAVLEHPLRVAITVNPAERASEPHEFRSRGKDCSLCGAPLDAAIHESEIAPHKFHPSLAAELRCAVCGDPERGLQHIAPIPQHDFEGSMTHCYRCGGSRANELHGESEMRKKEEAANAPHSYQADETKPGSRCEICGRIRYNHIHHPEES
jgi:hypothetical protein